MLLGGKPCRWNSPVRRCTYCAPLRHCMSRHIRAPAFCRIRQGQDNKRLKPPSHQQSCPLNQRTPSTTQTHSGLCKPCNTGKVTKQWHLSDALQLDLPHTIPCIDIHCLCLSTQRSRAFGFRAEHMPGQFRCLGGHTDLAPKFLGCRFQPASRVHGVTNGG